MCCNLLWWRVSHTNRASWSENRYYTNEGASVRVNFASSSFKKIANSMNICVGQCDIMAWCGRSEIFTLPDCCCSCFIPLFFIRDYYIRMFVRLSQYIEGFHYCLGFCYFLQKESEAWPFWQLMRNDKSSIFTFILSLSPKLTCVYGVISFFVGILLFFRSHRK